MATKTKKKTKTPVKKKPATVSMTSDKKGKTQKKGEKKGKKEIKKPLKKQPKKALTPSKKTSQKKISVRGAKTKPKTKPKAKPKQKPTAKSSVSGQKRTSPIAETKPITAKALRQEILRKQLIQRREEIVREVKSEIAKNTKGEANQVFETVLDDGDLSVVDLSADINLRLLETHRGSLLRIDEALRKLKEGSYGTCEDCGEEITSERLKVMPFAIYCRDCQETREVMEKVAKEEEI
jgi:DnaK suppressor protein